MPVEAKATPDNVSDALTIQGKNSDLRAAVTGSGSMQIVEESVGKVIASIPLILASIGAWASEFRYRAERSSD